MEKQAKWNCFILKSIDQGQKLSDKTLNFEVTTLGLNLCSIIY